MKIEYLGHSCFRIENEEGVTLVTDPYTKVGYEMPKVTADIVTVSHGHFDHNYLAGVGGSPVVIGQEGVCNYHGIEIVGTHTWHDPKQGILRGSNIIFRYVIDGVRICHFGDLGEGYSEKIAKIVSDCDVWLIPVGGTYTIDAAQATEYIEKLRPKAVIPMHYRPLDGGLDIAPIEVFLQKLKKESVLHCPKGEIRLVKDDLKVGETQILYMERKQ